MVVIDFIGNYEKNFLIPIALSGDRTFNKDTIRKYVQEGNRVIPGCSTIHFDEIATKRIYESINNASFSSIKFLKENYMELKYKLGRIPTLMDFYRNGSVDASLIFEKMKSYYAFLKKVEKDYTATLSKEQEVMIEFVSVQLANGKRPHELVLLQLLLEQECVTVEQVKRTLYERYGIQNDEGSIQSAFQLLMGGFIAGSDKVKYGNCKFIDVIANNGVQRVEEQTKVPILEGSVARASMYYQALQQMEYRKQLTDVVEYGLAMYEEKYMDEKETTNLKLYEKYSRKDVCRILNWESDESSTVYGYKIKHNTCIMFVTYNKSEDISDSTKYEDCFINPSTFSWMTRNRVSWDSKEPQAIFHHKEENIDIHLFVKKGDGEGRDFYYLGQVEPIMELSKETTIQDKHGNELPIVNIIYRLEHPVKEDVYEYLTK